MCILVAAGGFEPPSSGNEPDKETAPLRRDIFLSQLYVYIIPNF